MRLALSLAGWSFGWRVPAATLISAACIALAWRRSAKLAGLAPPAPTALLAELDAESPATVGESGAEQKRLAMIAELNQRLADVSFELGLLPALFTALTRVCLASGTALTLLGFLDWAQAPLNGGVRGFMCALSGLVGAGVVSALGRRAKRDVERTRQAWDRSSRELGRSLQTSLTASRE